MSLATKIQDYVLDSKSSLADALRHAKVLGAELHNQSFTTWVDNELRGYPADVPLPKYRQVHSPPLGLVSNGFYVHSQVPIPTFKLPDPLKKVASELRLGHSIREIEAMLEAPTGLQYQWSAENTMIANRYVNFGETYGIQAIHQPVTHSALAGVLDGVRTSLLDFLLELKQVNPDAIQDDSKLKKTDAEKVQQIFNVTMGNNGILATGQNVRQRVHQTWNKGDPKVLEQKLRDLGVSEEDAQELTAIVTTEENESLKAKAQGWLGRVVSSDTVTGASAQALVDLVKSLFS